MPMKKPVPITVACFLVVGLVALFPAQADAQQASLAQQLQQLRDSRPAELTLSGRVARWQPKVAFAEAQLTVAGSQGVVFQTTVTGGAFLQYDFTSQDGGVLADGNYAYEVSFSTPAGQPLRMSGNFNLVNGQPELQGTDAVLADPPSPAAIEGPSEEVFTHPGAVDIEGKLVVGNDSASSLSPAEIVIWSDANNVQVSQPANLVFINENSSGTLTENRTIVSDATGFRFGPQAFGVTSPAVVTFSDGPANSLYVASGGRVGLGTSVPSKKLDIRTSTIFDGVQITNDLGGGNVTSWNFAVDGFAGMTIQDAETSNGVMRLRQGAPSESLVITSQGSKGMGTASPEATLHVVEADDTKHSRVNVRLTGSDFAPQQEYEDGSTGAIWRMGMNPAGAFVFNQTDDLAVAELRVTAGGQVFVNGTQEHPDYVFKEGFELRSLDELEAYINEYGHLPGVLSSQQREKDGGIDLASFPVQLLEKIEELTLYTLQQQKELNALRAELVTLRQGEQE